MGSIESAIARPYCGYYRPIARKAAALVHSLALNHGFVDGNKRTALIVLTILLRRSGYDLDPGNADELDREVEEMILAVADHSMNFDRLVQWFKTRIRPYVDG